MWNKSECHVISVACEFMIRKQMLVQQNHTGKWNWLWKGRGAAKTRLLATDRFNLSQFCNIRPHVKLL